MKVPQPSGGTSPPLGFGETFLAVLLGVFGGLWLFAISAYFAVSLYLQHARNNDEGEGIDGFPVETVVLGWLW